jgi:sugar lactone lactonase YvrE
MTKACRYPAGAFLLLTLAATDASEGVKLRSLPAIYADDRGSGLRQPEGVAFDGKSLLAVADTGNKRLLKYTIAGSQVTPAGEIRLSEIPCPIKVQIGSRGELFALDGKSRRIARISPAGEFKGYVQPSGDGQAGPLIPRSFTIDREDNLYVLDVFQARVLVLDPAGRTQRTIAYPKKHGFLSDLAVDDKGTVFAIDSVGRRVFVARRADIALTPLTGGMQADMAFPTAIAVDDQGRIYVADQNGDGIVILGADGSFRGRQAGTGWKEGSLRYPSGLCAGTAGTIFVADRENGRVQMFAVLE